MEHLFLYRFVSLSYSWKTGSDMIRNLSIMWKTLSYSSLGLHLCPTTPNKNGKMATRCFKAYKLSGTVEHSFLYRKSLNLYLCAATLIRNGKRAILRFKLTLSYSFLNLYLWLQLLTEMQNDSVTFGSLCIMLSNLKAPETALSSTYSNSIPLRVLQLPFSTTQH